MSRKGKEIKYFLLRTVGVTLVSWLLKLIMITIRYRFNNREEFFKLRDRKEGVIYAFWHCDLIMIALTAKHFGFTKKDTFVLTSLSRDGELVSRLALKFDVKSVRGSSSRGGARGLLDLRDKVVNNANGAVAVDGPRGPRYEAKSGAIMLAKSSGVPIYPVAFNLSRQIVARSWDRTRIPLPFTRCSVDMGDPILIPPDITNEEIEAERLKFESILRELKEMS